MEDINGGPGPSTDELAAGQLTGAEPIDLGEGSKPQLESCVAEDIDKICKYNKDALKVYARKKFGFNLDLSAHIVIIRGNLCKRIQIALGQILEDPELDESTRQAIERVIPMYVKHPRNKRIFNATPALLKRMDLIPCTKEGRALGANEYYIPAPKPSYRTNSGSEMERLAAGMERQII